MIRDNVDRFSAPATRRLATALVAAFVLLFSCSSILAASDRPPIVATRGDAFVAHQNGSDLWTIGNNTIELVVGLDAAHVLALQRLSNPDSGRVWDITPGPDVSFTAGGESITLGASGNVSLTSATAQADDFGVTVTFTFEVRAHRLLVSRVYACYPGSPTIETWTKLSSTGGEGVTLTDLVGWQMTMPVAHLRWLGGLRGEADDNELAGAFKLADWDLAGDETVGIGADGRSSEQWVPFLIVDGERDEFYGGVQWSGSWRMNFHRTGNTMRLSAGFPGVSTSVVADHAVEVPHTFFGVAGRSATDESGALRQFVMQGIRHGRPFQPLVTYNTWFAYGAAIDEDEMVAEIDRAAALGVELFVVDAGWYVGAGTRDETDFDTGLGTWTVDPDRFPSGLASLADYAHGVGLRFGLWVEPERVALATVDRPGLAEQPWLAQVDGQYGAEHWAQICLAGPAAKRWVLDRLTALIEDVHPDYLKWDNNFWINCNRGGHDHGPGDGAFAHVRALYEVLDEIRRRYPNLMIENVSGGGRRMDFGMLAHTDTAWMDDRTAPSSHVRHDLEGLTFAFPPAYLLSFVIDASEEPISDDLPLVTRSRMPGVLGMTYRSDFMADDTSDALAREIALYKIYRDIIADGNATLLSGQAPVDADGWDVLQEVTDEAAGALIFGFKASGDQGRLVVHPRNLRADATYDVVSADVGYLGSATGADLMEGGVEFVHDGGSRAHVLILRSQ